MRMRTKEEYLALVLANRAVLASPEGAECPCPKRKCEWHGQCYECVRLHRHAGQHLPDCLQPIVQEQILALLRTVEMIATPKPRTPGEYWDYVNRLAPPCGRPASPPIPDQP